MNQAKIGAFLRELRKEKGLTQEKCDNFFGPLLETLKPIIQHVISAKPVDETLLNVHFPIADQLPIPFE